MNRDAAIEAGARALFESRTSRPWEMAADDRSDVRPIWRREAAAIIDAALPHLQPEPIGYEVRDVLGNLEAGTFQDVETARRWIGRDIRGFPGPLRVVALVPVDEP